MHRIGDHIFEMKRLFVLPRLHGKGVGRALVHELLNQARSAGYTKMQLETNIKQKAAQGLYRNIGFEEIPPYYELPKDV
jgi:ribosomal protein S18 acetylase RimI-like enzyme